MKWLSLCLAIMELINSVTRYMEKTKIVKETEARVIEQATKRAKDRIELALEAAAESALSSAAGGLRDKDKYSRD